MESNEELTNTEFIRVHNGEKKTTRYLGTEFDAFILP